MKKLIFFPLLVIFFVMGIGDIQVLRGQPSSNTFDLLLFGRGWTGGNVQVSLKRNPGTADKWEVIGPDGNYVVSQYGVNSSSILLIQDLSARRFAGQDIRENYIALRLKLLKDSAFQKVDFRSAYALKHPHTISRNTLHKWITAIRENPLMMRRKSFASLTYPRSKRLKPGNPYIDHIELPVRHLKAGLQEVRWLEILFTP